MLFIEVHLFLTLQSIYDCCPYSQVRRLRNREVKYLSQVHTRATWLLRTLFIIPTPCCLCTHIDNGLQLQISNSNMDPKLLKSEDIHQSLCIKDNGSDIFQKYLLILIT